MPRKKVIPANQVLHSQIHGWATKNDVIDDPYILGLSEAVLNKKHLDSWETFNPLEYLPRPEGFAGAKRLRYARYISIFRNILVFAPVAITWEAVSKATTAFADSVQSNNAATVNFLEFWQNGYDVLDKKWTISNIAQIDFLIVAVVIVLSLIASTLNERGRYLRIQESESIETERTQLAIAIRLFMYTKRQVSNVSLNQDLASVVQSLINAAQFVETSSEKLQKSVKDFPNDAPLKKELREFIKLLNSTTLKKSKS